MKNKIVSAVTACGVLIAGLGMLGLSSEGQAGFALAVKITAVGLVIAGAGQLIRKVANKKEHATLDKYMLSTNDIGN